MKLPTPFIQLPLCFDAPAMAAEIEALGEAVWRPHPQGFPGNSMLPLLALGGDPANEGYSGRMLPTPELLRCPYVVRVLGSLGATLGRTRLMRLAGQAEVTRHVDQGYYWAERVRVHVPIVTQPSVRFECGDEAINMAAGECWIFDTWRQHQVFNDASRPRIHLVADTVGGGRFWQLVAAGRPSRDAAAPWRPTMVRPEPGATSELALESVNIPVLMSPWEMEGHFRLIFGEAKEDSQLALVRDMARLFIMEWRGLWARFGTSPEGARAYRISLDAFLERVEPVARRIELCNGVNCFGVIMTLIAKFAISPELSVTSLGENNPSPLVSR